MQEPTLSRILRLCIVLLLTLTVLTLLAACGGNGGQGEASGTADEASGAAETTDVTGPDTAAPETAPDAGTGTEPSAESDTQPADDNPGAVYPASQAGAKSGTVLSVADFGAKGDGVTDDGPAVSAAVRAAAEQHAALTFEAGKTYYIGSSDTTVNDQHGPLVLSGASGVTIDGQGATLKVQPGLAYFSLIGCEDVRVRNFIFDYSVSVYMVGTADRIRGNTVTYKTDIDPYLDDFDFSRVTGFSIKYNEGLQQRPHAFIGQMRKTADKTVSVEYPNGAPVSKGDVVFLPNPGVGCAYNAPVFIGGCTGAVVCENVTIRAASTMSVVINRNEAEIYFENTDLMPDTEDGRAIHMVGWRDGYHVSDNRLPIHWNKCEAGVMFDDAFNIYGALGYIKAVGNDNTMTACHYGRFLAGAVESIDVRAGDVLDFYNNVIGEYYGCATVREAVQNPNGTTSIYFEYGQDVRNVPVGAQIANRSTGAPGTTFTDCAFEGTFRFHRGIRFENTDFKLLCMWIMVEDNGEGPLPGDIDFVNCTLSGPPQLDAMNRAGNKYFTNLGSHITDIGFWGCRMEGTLRTRSDCKWTTADTWTEADLFTVKHKKSAEVTPVEIAPADYDFLPGVVYDWTLHTMPVTGADAAIVSGVTDDALRAAMQAGDGFLSCALLLKSDTLTLDGLTASRLPCLYKPGNRYTLAVTVVSDKDGTCALKTSAGTADALPFSAGNVGTLTFTYIGESGLDGLSLVFTGGGTVYVGSIRVSMAVNANPSMNQLLNGHTFIWTDEVRVGEGAPMRVSDADKAVRDALQGASGCTTGTVLHLTGKGGDFTGLSGEAYCIPGKTYRISLDAYVVSPAAAGAVTLTARCPDGEDRVLAENLFTEAGLCHIELNWTVGDTGETGLALVVNGAGADVWLGDLTITAKLSYKPDHYIDVWPFAGPTAEEFHEGFIFDSTDGHMMDFGYWGDAHCTIGSFDEPVYEKLKAAGFGEKVYYVNTGFHLGSIEQMHPGGHRMTITLEVYDGLENLAAGAGNGLLVQRNMLNGEDTGPWLDCTVRTDPNDPQHLWLTFESDLTTDPALISTEDIVIFATEPVEFIIWTIEVHMD